MAVIPNGYSAELLYQVNEEVLGTTFYFKNLSGYSGTNGTVNLAIAMIDAVDDILEGFGSDVRIHAVKCRGLAPGPAWTRTELIGKSGTGATASELDFIHARVNIVSENIQGTVKRNRNQVAGIPDGDVDSGRVGEDLVNVWLTALNNWSQGSVQNGGFQYFLAVGFRTNNNWFFADAEAFRISPFAGTRIDRVLNRPNTGRKKTAEVPPVDPA